MQSPFRADCLRGKVALVTGGGSGIGFQITRQIGGSSFYRVFMHVIAPHPCGIESVPRTGCSFAVRVA